MGYRQPNVITLGSPSSIPVAVILGLFDCIALARRGPFVVSLSNHGQPFDRLRANGNFLPLGNNRKALAVCWTLEGRRLPPWFIIVGRNPIATIEWKP